MTVETLHKTKHAPLKEPTTGDLHLPADFVMPQDTSTTQTEPLQKTKEKKIKKEKPKEYKIDDLDKRTKDGFFVVTSTTEESIKRRATEMRGWEDIRGRVAQVGWEARRANGDLDEMNGLLLSGENTIMQNLVDIYKLYESGDKQTKKQIMNQILDDLSRALSDVAANFFLAQLLFILPSVDKKTFYDRLEYWDQLQKTKEKNAGRMGALIDATEAEATGFVDGAKSIGKKITTGTGELVGKMFKRKKITGVEKAA